MNGGYFDLCALTSILEPTFTSSDSKFKAQSSFLYAPIAQLDRAFDFESKGRRFESSWVHQLNQSASLLGTLFFSD